MHVCVVCVAVGVVLILILELRTQYTIVDKILHIKNASMARCL